MCDKGGKYVVCIGNCVEGSKSSAWPAMILLHCTRTAPCHCRHTPHLCLCIKCSLQGCAAVPADGCSIMCLNLHQAMTKQAVGCGDGRGTQVIHADAGSAVHHVLSQGWVSMCIHVHTAGWGGRAGNQQPQTTEVCLLSST